MSQTPSTVPDQAIAAVRAGRPVLVHDAADREGEVDMVYPAEAVTPDAVARLRNDAGGLICVAVTHEIAEAFGLPFLQEAVDHPAAANNDLEYDDRSSFSVTVNHRDTYTGITDNDRSLTIRELATAVSRPDSVDFANEFRTPGHVHVLRGAPNLLADRAGHTELGLAIADAAGMAPAMVVCEMLDDNTGGARSPARAKAYARRHGLAYVEGAELMTHLG